MQERVLEILAQHPLLSPEQLGVLLAAHPNVVRKELKPLQEKNLVTRINPRSPEISSRVLFYVTPNGLAQKEKEASLQAYAQRLAHLWFVIERVYAVRNLFLRMRQPFHIQPWDVEAKTHFLFRNRARLLTAHGVGVTQFNHGPVSFVVEWDTGILEYEQPRMARLIEWHSTFRVAAPKHNSIPFVLLIVAEDVHRLQAYYTTLRAVSLSRNLPLLPTYLATTRDVEGHAITAPIWYSAEGKSKQVLFSNLHLPANTNFAPRLPNLGRQSATNKHVMDPVSAEFNASHPTSAPSLLALKRELSPQTKRALNEVATHPLLTAAELATLLDDLSGQVQRALKQLTQLGLVQAHEMCDETRYLLGEVGIHYLAAMNGFGRAVKSYRKARGWKKSLSQLVRYWKHTHIENELFLDLAHLARERQARFEWRSENESRMYFTAQGRRWSFVPDGLCLYADKEKRLRIAVEIERHRNSKKRLRSKFNWYAMYVDATLYRTAREEEFRLLVVTTSWGRAKIIRQVIFEIARLRSSAVLPLWITTFDLLNEQRVGKPIWRKVDTWERTTCI